MSRRFSLLVLFVSIAGRLPAQQTTPAPASVDLQLAPQAQCRGAQGQPKDCELGDSIYVGFTNLHAWMDADVRNKPQDLVLVLDGRVMKGLTPRGPDTQYKELAFDLRRLTGSEPDNKANRDAWNALLSGAKTNRSVSVGVAMGGNPPYYRPATARLQMFPPYSGLVVAFLVMLLIVFLLLARRSDILRDGPSIAGKPQLSFSLARCQMAFWFFVILASYNYIWMVTGDRDSVTQGALILIGISAATGLSAMVVDSSKRDQRKTLENEGAAIVAHAPVLDAAMLAAPSAATLSALQAERDVKQKRMAEVRAALSSLPTPPGASQGFLVDILRDETGVSFHRFQMATWTIVLGFVFIVSVYQSLAMPDFSATLLGLMGISSGTYIGFKIPDSPKPSGG